MPLVAKKSSSGGKSAIKQMKELAARSVKVKPKSSKVSKPSIQLTPDLEAHLIAFKQAVRINKDSESTKKSASSLLKEELEPQLLKLCEDTETVLTSVELKPKKGQIEYPQRIEVKAKFSTEGGIEKLKKLMGDKFDSIFDTYTESSSGGAILVQTLTEQWAYTDEEPEEESDEEDEETEEEEKPPTLTVKELEELGGEKSELTLKDQFSRGEGLDELLRVVPPKVISKFFNTRVFIQCPAGLSKQLYSKDKRRLMQKLLQMGVIRRSIYVKNQA